MSCSVGSVTALQTSNFHTRAAVAAAPSLSHVSASEVVFLPRPPKIFPHPISRIADYPGRLLGARRPSNRISIFRCFSGYSEPFSPALTAALKTTLDKVVSSHKVVLFMKGTKEFPQCGFSNTIVQILKSLNVPFESINILENEILRQGLKEYSSWPTFPQLYIDGEFFGGCDITVEAYQSGELQELLEKAMCS